MCESWCTVDLYAECHNVECMYVCMYVYIYIYIYICQYFPISVQRSLLPTILTTPQSIFNDYKRYIIFIY